MNEQLQEALRLVHAGRRALWLARQMQERRDLLAAHDPHFDDIIGALVLECMNAEARCAALIGHDGVTDASGNTITVARDDRRARPRWRFLFLRNANARRAAS
jgi:hypothetical protein